MPKNISTVLELCSVVKEKYPNKNIWCWTGYTLQEVQNNHASGILQYCDVLIDGKFIDSQNSPIIIKNTYQDSNTKDIFEDAKMKPYYTTFNFHKLVQTERSSHIRKRSDH